MGRLAPLALALATVAPCAALAAAAALVPACSSPAPAVRLSSAWPESPAGYADATAAWTREAKVYDGVDHVFTLRATAKSTEWRAAYVAERARRQRLGDEARGQLAASEQAAAAETWEFQVLLATHDAQWNDLAKGPKSIWRLSLVSDDGREVLPTEVKADRRPVEEIGAWFPGMAPFFKAYVVTFPARHADGAPVCGEGARRLALRLGGALGSAELEWRAP